MSQIFISHSTPAATAFGLALKPWLQFVLGDNIKVWISADIEDLPQGRDEHRRIINAAKNSFACVSILTPQNYRRPWILFEPGIFYGGDEKEVLMILCGGLRHNHLQEQGYPIEGYAAYAVETQLKNFVISLNKKTEKPRDSKLLEESFDFKKDTILAEYNKLFLEDGHSLVESDQAFEDAISKIYD